jgi:hypothetical protein
MDPLNYSFRTGLEVMQERRGREGFSTGSQSLDRLIGGIETQMFYLFYGGQGSGVDLLLHHVMVNSLSSGEGKTVYLNCGNYRREKTIMDLRLLTRLMKTRGLDPSHAMKRIYVIPAFSKEQQYQAVEKATHLVGEKGFELMVIQNLSGLFTKEPGGPDEMRLPLLNRIITDAWRACRENRATMAATCRSKRIAWIEVPIPEGGSYLTHMAGVVVYFYKREDQHFATLMEHPSMSPNRGRFHPSYRDPVAYDYGEGMGITSLQIQLQGLVKLEGEYLKELRDQGPLQSLDNLVEAWRMEGEAIRGSHALSSLELTTLAGILENRGEIMGLKDRIRTINELQEGNIPRPESKLCRE